MLGALFGSAAGLIESWMASASIRKAQGFMELGGYAVLIDGGVFAAIGAVAALLATVAAPLLGRQVGAARITAAGLPVGVILVGLLMAYRWNQLFNKEAAPDSPEVLYAVAVILCAAALLAVVAAFAASAALRRRHGPALPLRRALPLALAALFAAAGLLVGRDQVTHRLATAPPAAVAGEVGATTPRSPAGRPPDEAIAPPPAPPLAPPLATEPSRARPPNVLLVTVGSLRADHLGIYGYEQGRTPNIDALARSGARFTNAMSQQPNTNAAHAAILTGTYPATNGVRADLVDQLDPSTPTLARELAGDGYRTAAIFSWVSFEPAFSGLDRGFHDYLDLAINRPEYLSDNRAQVLAATYRRLKAYLAVPGALDGAFSLGDVEQALDGKADVTTEAAIAWLEEHGETPFFLWVHYFDPHYPYSPPSPFDVVEETGCGDTCPDGSLKTIRDIEAGARLNAAQINHLVGLYDGEIAFTDQQIGRLLGRLEQLGLAANTMVVLTADHGQSFAEHDAWFNGSDLHNAQTQVPLLVAMPGRIDPGTVVAEPAMGIDLPPTILDAVGAPVPDRFEGQSLLALLLGHGVRDRRLAISELADRSQLAVADRDWKLIWSAGDQSARLYDVRNDPNELNDRSEDEPEVTARLLTVL
ncbi:MAG TPA: sulfatase, partial [Geminicoccaceae bacterium]|nr:sulfatase [Geminicoccaceae bacterium]